MPHKNRCDTCRERAAKDDRPAPGALGLHLHRVDRARMVLHVTGELDRLTAPVLVAFLDERLGREPVGTDLTIDLAETSFVDLRGLDALLDVQRRAWIRGIVVHVGPCRASFLRLLRVTWSIGLTAATPERPRSHRPVCGSAGGRRRQRRQL